MWNVPSKERLDRIPRLYETEKVPLKEKQIYLHFFLGSCDWYVAEFDGSDLFWGYAILNGDLQNAEWGYISFRELKDINIGGIEIDCELEDFFPVKQAVDIENICKGMRWGKHEQAQVSIENLLAQAVNHSAIDLQCPRCGLALSCEPDAQKAYCFDCNGVVQVRNPLIDNGLI